MIDALQKSKQNVDATGKLVLLEQYLPWKVRSHSDKSFPVTKRVVGTLV